MAQCWHVLRTEPRAEYLTADVLGREGVDVFFPCVKAPNPRPGHDNTPLFPGYLFLRFDPVTEGWPSFRPAHHVAGWVSFHGVVPTVPDGVIADLQQRIETINGGDGLWRRFHRGEKVRVVSNNLDGLAEVVEEAKSPQGRAKVLLHFMGRIVHAQVPWESLRPISDRSEDRPRLPRRTRGKGRWIQGFGPGAAIKA